MREVEKEWGGIDDNKNEMLKDGKKIQFTVIIYMCIYSLLEMFLMIRLKVGAWGGDNNQKKKK